MRRNYWIVGAVAASLTLSACGVSASINQAVSSIGSSPDLQVHLTATVSGKGSGAAQMILPMLSVDMHYASTTGAALSSSSGQISSEFALKMGTSTLADIRQVGTNAYLRLDFTPLGSVSGLGITTTQLADAQLLLAGRWFEIPQSLMTSYLPTTTVSASQSAKEKAAAQALLDAITTLIERTPYTTLSGGGYRQTGSLDSVVKAVLPVFEKLTGQSAPLTKSQGSYILEFTMSGTTATGGSIEFTAPNGSSGNATIGLHATITHDAQSVTAPGDATVVTKAILSQLTSQFGQALG